jgi:hypothetical protein
MSSFFKEDVIRTLAAAKDQAKTVVDIIGKSLDHITLTGADVVLAVYIEKEMSKNGIILPTQRLEESIYQSKVGLVIKAGPDAFKFKGSFAWVSPDPKEVGKDGKFTKAYYERAKQYTPKVGDWVIHFPTDSKLFGLNGVPCRYSLDSSVKMITTEPDAIL